MILGIVAILTIVNTFYIHHLCNLVYEELDKKDKKIEKIKISSRFTRNQKVIIHKTNEIIDRLNGEENEL